MRRVLTLAVAGLLIGAVAGCNDAIIGNWTSKEVKPPESARNFKIGRISFEKVDNIYRYACSADYGSGTQDSKGTYNFNGFQLKLKSDEGKERSYGAQYNSFNRTLSVINKEHGQKTTVVLTKAE